MIAVTWPLALAPAHLWPPHHDARVFTWIMASMARRLLTEPWALFHGNAFYPFGESLAFSEPLVIPSLLGLPGFVWGNPVLTYNLLLLALWPLNGVAMAWVAHRLTESRPAAWLAGAVFCLSPYFTEYYLEFQMLLAALLPVVVYAWVRWLETQEPRWLALALGGLTVQGLTTWYYTVIVGLALVTLALGFLCLRWRGWVWRRNLVALAVGGLGVAAVLLPIALPYVTAHRELGFDRDIRETSTHYADLFTFVEPASRSLLARLNPLPLSGGIAETSSFAGFTVLVLAAASLAWLRTETPAATPGIRLRRLALAALVAALPVLAWAMAVPHGLRLGPLRLRPRAGVLLDAAVILGFAVLLLRGWAAARGAEPRQLGRGDWVRLLLLLTGICAILALGPVIHVGRREVSPGPYLLLYEVLLPLQAIRVTTRFAVITTAGLALLAALGLAAVEARLRTRSEARRLVLVALFLALGCEYAVRPAEYEQVTAAPRAVDAALRADIADVAILEWPAHWAAADADAMVRSLYHAKRLVNGLSGFAPDFLGELSRLLTTPGPPFPVPEAQAVLRRVYPLRYLVVRLADPETSPEWRPVWLALRRAPPSVLRFLGTYGDEDLYEVVPLPERGVWIERWASYDFVRGHSVARLTVRPLAASVELEQWANILFNGRSVQRVPLDAAATVTVTLAPPFHRAAPNVVTVSYGYRRPPAAFDARYRIGATGVTSPGDLRVRSAGQPYGDVGSIEVNGNELAPRRRGYNLVALDPGGRLRGAEAFDTFFDPEAAARLAAWVAALPAGTIVGGAVRDEGSGRLTAAAVGALGTLGVAGDLRGRFRESHAFVGVKGAPPGTALEAMGPRALRLVVGQAVPGLELTAFALDAAPPAEKKSQEGPVSPAAAARLLATR